MTQNAGGTTTEPPRAAPPPETPRRRRRWLSATAIVIAVAFGVTAIVANFVHVPYVIISPGEAMALDQQIVSVSGAPTYAHRGDLLFLTVRVSNADPSVWRYLFAQLDDDVSVVKKQDVIGCATFAESARLNTMLMQQSQDEAKTVALRRLGYQVVDAGSEAVVVNVLCGGPAQGRLEQGDVITTVDGTPVTVADEVGPLVRAHTPGEDVALGVERGGKHRDVTVRLGEHDGEALLGIQMQTVTHEQYPFEVNIDTSRIGGPSAGLAFTLAIIDTLTPGNLTGAKRVAVTGTIEPDGSVGIVGGVEQKTVTARDAGVKLMLVPVGEAKGAREHADGIHVVAVRTLDDALRALEHAGGAPVPASPGGQAPPTGQ
jgi:Lon-like protease